jgi:hypothetical protein
MPRATREPAMNRRSTIVGLAAVTLALLVGCGKESKSASCRDESVKIYKGVVKLLKDGSPSDPHLDDKMLKILGTHGPPKDCKDPRLANPILDQVAHEFGPQLVALEGKWGHDALNGFRDPLNAGHGEPVPSAPPGS